MEVALGLSPPGGQTRVTVLGLAIRSEACSRDETISTTLVHARYSTVYQANSICF